MKLFGRKSDRTPINIDDAKKQLHEAQEKSKEVEAHTSEVERVASESIKHARGNGFYELFKQSLGRSPT